MKAHHHQQQYLSRFVAVIVFLTRAVWIVSSTSSSNYVPVTALDKYGNSLQLEHARQAAMKHGRVILAARATQSSNNNVVGEVIVVVASVYAAPQWGISSTNGRNRSSRRNGVLQALWTTSSSTSTSSQNDENNNDASSATLYLACSGVKADARWLVDAMRDYAKRLWDRYNVEHMSQERAIQALSVLLLQFMGYNRSHEWQDGVSPVENGNEESASSWARPLGIQTLVVSASSPIVLVEPSGATVAASPSSSSSSDCAAIGKESEAISRDLRERYGGASTSVQEVKDLLVDIIRKHHVQHAESHASQEPSTAQIVLEVVSKQGVDESSVPLVRPLPADS